VAEGGVVYPDYFLRHHHFLPGGYLSEAGARGYEHAIRPIYYQLRERAVARRVVAILRARGALGIAEFGGGPGRMLAAIARAIPRAQLAAVELSPRMLLETGRRLAHIPRIPVHGSDLTGRGSSLSHLPLSAIVGRGGRGVRAQRPAGQHVQGGRSNSRAAAARDVRLLHVDAASTPIAGGSLDAVVACHLLGHIPRAHAARVVAEAHRVLRTGGMLLLVEHAWHTIATPGFEIGRAMSFNGGILTLTCLEREGA